jgi:hypothetical protein
MRWTDGEGGFWKLRCLREHSCEDSNAAQSSITRCEEVALATVWEGLVCWLYDVDNRELIKSWD